jgi:hypothetical protein
MVKLLRCENCGKKLGFGEYSKGECPNCGAKLWKELQTTAHATRPTIAIGEASEISGAGIASIFIVLGWISIIVGVGLCVFGVALPGLLMAALVAIDVGLVTVMLGVLTKATVTNANINRRILEHLTTKDD